MNILEAIMLICFGCAWPLSIIKQFRSKDSGGKSPLFSYIIILGYIAGIANKLLTGADWVMWLYALNICMVATDLMLIYRYRKRKPGIADEQAQ